MIGSLVVWIGLASSIASAVLYYLAAIRKNNSLSFARRAFQVSVFSTIFSSALLMALILTHRFDFSYVWSYSSRDLPAYLLVTSFWAGQEGSFLLWALFGAIIGLVLQLFCRRRGFESNAMSVYSLLQAFLLILVAVKSPFEYIWNAHPGQFATGEIPLDGRGLNPLLQNLWMAIHPPILFVGFAAAAVPFVLAVLGLWKRIYSEWIPMALPWVLFSALSLGAGIMLGGYWAYGVLGWGGWWGWDPVENSSLVPWIVCVILLHTLIVQKKTGKFTRTNFVLAILTFVLVLYSTFLTRSGILGESSVHSFVDPGMFAYTLLVVWLLSVALLGARMIQLRWKDLAPAKRDEKLFNRESFIGLAALVMGLSALIILFGTSLPILSRTTVEPAFYNNSNLPLAIAMGLLLGVSLILRWGEGTRQDFFRRLRFPLVGSIAVQALLWSLGVRDVSMSAFTLTSLFVLFVNLERGLQVVRERARFIGGPVAHIGLALLFLGIAGSGFYGQKEIVSLSKHDSKEILGYKLTYVDLQPAEGNKTKYVIKAERDGDTETLEPVMFTSSYNNSQMRNPDYVSFLTKDLYIEPVSVEQEKHLSGHDVVTLQKGVAMKVGDFQVKFTRFDMNAHGSDQMASGGGMTVGAVIEVKSKSTVEQVIPVTTYADGKQIPGKAAMLKNNKVGFQLVNMIIDMQAKNSTVDVAVFGLNEPATVLPSKEILVLEVSVKPFINLVWLGTICIIAGFFVAMMTRGKEVLILSKKPSNGKSKKGSNLFGHDRNNEIQQEQSVKEEVAQ